MRSKHEGQTRLDAAQMKHFLRLDAKQCCIGGAFSNKNAFRRVNNIIPLEFENGAQHTDNCWKYEESSTSMFYHRHIRKIAHFVKSEY